MCFTVLPFFYSYMEIVVIILVIVVAVLLVLYLTTRSNFVRKCVETENLTLVADDFKRKYDELKAESLSNLEEISGLQRKLTDLRIENARLQERMSVMESERAAVQKASEDRFRILANEIFVKQSDNFRQNSEARLSELLNPLRENIKDFKKTITDNYVNEAKERHALSVHLENLMALNQSIGKEARELTNALKGDTKVQGDWGEMILESILEKSGLIKDENYFIQSTRNDDGSLLKNDSGQMLRPDVVVCLPDKKYIVIDSKVSLTAYNSYINAENDDSKDAFGKAHVASVRNHIRELDAKQYQKYVGVSANSRLDYVLMFIPNEHAYLVAMSLDRNLWQEAFDRHIVIISPAHVISTLRLIAQLWIRDKQTKNALLIAEESGKLYDKFVGFVNDMKEIEIGMIKLKSIYDGAFKKLSDGKGNLIERARVLKALGAKASKSLPEEL